MEVEMPAPVKTTRCEADAISEASSRTLSARDRSVSLSSGAPS